MTHKDIYTKFLIEYDKANVTSSYPSLTEYEIATVLDKAYNALIAQKVTGNNIRRVPFEADVKAISDIQPLIVTDVSQRLVEYTNPLADNIRVAVLPEDFLYYVSSCLFIDMRDKNSIDKNEALPTLNSRKLPVQLVDHTTASKFFNSAHNIPWIKNPVCYIEGNKIYFVYDPVYIERSGSNDTLVTSYTKLEDGYVLMYVKRPNEFVKILKESEQDKSFFDCPTKEDGTPTDDRYIFECNSTVAEELVSLAISFALENVESPRLNTKLNMRGLEA